MSGDVELSEFELVDTILVLLDAWEGIKPELIHSAWSAFD